MALLFRKKRKPITTDEEAYEALSDLCKQVTKLQKHVDLLCGQVNVLKSEIKQARFDVTDETVTRSEMEAAIDRAVTEHECHYDHSYR